MQSWKETCIFQCNKAAANMLRSVREAAGLGCPPSPYYTNDSERYAQQNTVQGFRVGPIQCKDAGTGATV